MNRDETLPISLLVVDDHNLFRRGLIALLALDARFRVVGEAADASAAQTSARKLQPDLILLDNHLPGVAGVDAIAGLKQVAPNARVIMLTVSEDVEDLAAALRAGADGYLLKIIHTEQLCDYIQKVWEGDSVVSPELMGKLVALLRKVPIEEQAQVPDIAPSPSRAPQSGKLDADDPIHTLSPREREILALLVEGSSNKLIARRLDIAEATVKIHVQHILRKLGMSTRVHAAVYAMERGITGEAG